MILIFVVLSLQCLYVCGSIITTADIDTQSQRLQSALQQQSIQTILIAIENRLRNLDNVYTMQHSPTLVGKLELYAKRLETVDTKINRMESILNLQMDKVYENISTKNFKDDITKTMLFNKIDAIYEGISHRMGYIEKKIEASNLKVQNKLNELEIKIDKMEDALVTRNADIEAQLTDVATTVDDLRTTCIGIETNIINANKEIINKTLVNTERSSKDGNRYAKRSLEEINKAIANKLQEIKDTVTTQVSVINATNSVLNLLKKESQDDTNDYANKVADMYAEMWNMNKDIKENLKSIIITVNATRNENQAGLRSLTVQIGKVTSKDVSSSGDIPQSDAIIKISKKIDTNFEKLNMKQDLFLEGCHKLQKDESQIESKISVILERLLETFEKKSVLLPQDLAHIEKLLKTHDSNSRRHLSAIGNNIGNLIRKIAVVNDGINELKSEMAALPIFLDDNQLPDYQPANYSIMLALQEVEKKLLQVEQTPIQLKNATHIGGSDQHDTGIQQIKDYLQNINVILHTIQMNFDTYRNNMQPTENTTDNLFQQLNDLINIKGREVLLTSNEIAINTKTEVATEAITNKNENELEESTTSNTKDNRIEALLSGDWLLKSATPEYDDFYP